MSSQNTISTLMVTALFTCLGLAATIAPLTPVSPGGFQIKPDALYCVVIVWVVRSPGTAPFWIIFILGLLADILLARPIGPGALALLVVSEIARGQHRFIKDTRFITEWLLAITGLTLSSLAIHAVLRLTFVTPPDLRVMLTLVIQTGILYPVIAGAIAVGMRIFGRRTPVSAPGVSYPGHIR